MLDFRITALAPQDVPQTTSLAGALIHLADDIAERFELVSSNLPYSTYRKQLQTVDVARTVAEVGAATWKRIGREVPSYAYAEALGRRYSEAGVSMGIVLLHWQILRRAIHLVLADQRIRTGQGSEDLLRQSTLLNYILDWSIEASLVGYILSKGRKLNVGVTRD